MHVDEANGFLIKLKNFLKEKEIYDIIVCKGCWTVEKRKLEKTGHDMDDAYSHDYTFCKKCGKPLPPSMRILSH